MENETIIKTNQVLEVIDTITKSVLELDETMLGYFLALIQFHQRVNKIFFGDEEYEEFDKEVDKALNEFLKIKKELRTNDDFVKVKKLISKSVEKYGSIKGKPIIMEIAIKLTKHYQVKDISTWVFEINRLYDGAYEMYDWMY